MIIITIVQEGNLNKFDTSLQIDVSSSERLLPPWGFFFGGGGCRLVGLQITMAEPVLPFYSHNGRTGTFSF